MEAENKQFKAELLVTKKENIELKKGRNPKNPGSRTTRNRLQEKKKEKDYSDDDDKEDGGGSDITKPQKKSRSKKLCQ